MINIVYFSNITGNTAKFVEKLNIGTTAKVYRIPLKGELDICLIDPYILITPTYGDPHKKGMIPHQVKKFLNEKDNLGTLSGVIAGGNMNFGKEYGLAGDIISHKFKIPLLYKFELAGTDQDVERVRQGLSQLGTTPKKELTTQN